MVHEHVYYLPFTERVHGGGSVELADALRRIWARHRTGRAHWYDGVSTWVREDGERVARLCRTRDPSEGAPVVDVIDVTHELVALPLLHGTGHASGIAMHPIHRLRELGQSVWLDFIDREILTSGELRRMIEQDGLCGLTSNPSMFERAISASSAYDAIIAGADPDESDAEVLDRVVARDVTLACDIFRPLYDRTRGGDGYVSIQVAPEVAHDTAASIAEARRLWRLVSRPNLMVQISGTRDGLGAIEQCLSEGMNVNITLLFSVARYLEVVAAYVRGLESRVEGGHPLERVASAASFFVSGVDAKVDREIDRMTGSRRECGSALRGQVAIANAKIAYAEFERVFAGERWRRLAEMGASPQRLLWASTTPMDPAYRELHYADALIGPHTVDTMTKETLRAYIAHGSPGPRLAQDRARARDLLSGLATVGVNFPQIAQELEDEGVRSFAESHDRAVRSIAEKRRVLESA